MYSLSWAKDVVEGHYRQHARAAYFMLVSHGYTLNTLALWLAKRDPRWEIYKGACKIIEDRTINSLSFPNAKQVLRYLVEYYGKNFDRGGSNMLQDLEDGRTLSEQFFKGTPPEGRADKQLDLPGQLYLPF